MNAPCTPGAKAPLHRGALPAGQENSFLPLHLARFIVQAELLCNFRINVHQLAGDHILVVPGHDRLSGVVRNA
jgi:hypothetical protein